MTRPIDLSMNEMPFPPPEQVVTAARAGLALLHRYAGQRQLDELRALLSRYTGVPQSYIVPGPGSDYLLREIIYAFSGGRKVIMVSPSFMPTVQKAKQFATKLVSLRLSPPAFRLHPDMLWDELTEPALVIIDNPNNPTGTVLLDRTTVEALVAREDVRLVIDEAYFEFSGVTFADMIVDHPNLAITRTLDKAFSLAGARIGYLIAGAPFRDVFAAFRALLPQTSLHAAIAALQSASYMEDNVRVIIAERDRLHDRLIGLHVPVYSSHTNFLLASTGISDIASRLREQGVVVSDVSNQCAEGSIRISIGRPEENDAFIDALRTILD